MFQYFLYKFALFIIHLVPRRWAYGLAEFLADQQFHYSHKDREAVMRNLRQITGRQDVARKDVRRVFLNFGRYLVDFFLMYKMVDASFVRDHVTVNGLEHLTVAHGQGRGVVILTAHIGNWEMGAAVLRQLGFPVTAIALPHKNPKVNILFNRQREAHGVTVVPTSVAVRRCLGALRKGGLVALLGDRDFGSFGKPLSFLGRTTLIPQGAAFFASRTGAPIVPCFLKPDGDGHYTMDICSPICLSAGDTDKEAPFIAVMAQYAALIEDKIRKDPTQWLMFREFGIEF